MFQEVRDSLSLVVPSRWEATTFVMPSSFTIDAVTASSVSAVTPFPVARNTATRAGCWF